MIEGNVFIYFHISLAIITGIILFISLLSGLFETEQKNKKLNNNDKTILISLILTIFLFGTYMYGFNRCEKSKWMIRDIPYSTEKIISMNDNNIIHGRFYLRHGSIDEDLYYQYIVQLDNGGFVANKVNSKQAIIYYDSDNYRVEWYIKKKKWMYFEMEEIYNKIYIPKGSIIDEFTIDLN